jgi:hypothetical protein
MNELLTLGDLVSLSGGALVLWLVRGREMEREEEALPQPVAA